MIERWRDKACFEAHIATPNVKHAEDRLKRKKILIEPATEWHFTDSSTAHRAVATKNCRVNFTAWQTVKNFLFFEALRGPTQTNKTIQSLVSDELLIVAGNRAFVLGRILCKRRSGGRLL